MKSMVASATEFMSVATKALGALLMGPLARPALQQFGDARHRLVACRTGLGRDFIGYAELRQCAPFLGVGNRPIGPVLPDLKELFTDAPHLPEALSWRRTPSHL